MNESGKKDDRTKSKKKKSKQNNQTNLTVAELADQFFNEYNYDVMMLLKVGSYTTQEPMFTCVTTSYCSYRLSHQNIPQLPVSKVKLCKRK